MTSRDSKRRPVALVGGLIGLMLITGALLPALSSTPTREVRLVVKGMAFYLEGDSHTPNPTIDVRAGERVRVVVRNEDRGLTHDFAVPALRRASRAIEWSQSAAIAFDAPESPGDYEYVCQPHRLMMRGTVRVVP
jgi:plastocyanin